MDASSVIAPPSPIDDIDWLHWGGESDVDASDADALAAIPGSSPPVPHHSLIVEAGGALRRYREFVDGSADPPIVAGGAPLPAAFAASPLVIG
eukprot:gene5032-78_t